MTRGNLISFIGNRKDLREPFFFLPWCLCFASWQKKGPCINQDKTGFQPAFQQAFTGFTGFLVVMYLVANRRSSRMIRMIRMICMICMYVHTDTRFFFLSRSTRWSKAKKKNTWTSIGCCCWFGW